MYARTTTIEIDTLRIGLDEAIRTFEEAVLPRLREQPGFLGVYAMSTPEGRGLLISFWESAEQADSAGDTGWYPDLVREYMTLFRSPVGRGHYEVHLALAPGSR